MIIAVLMLALQDQFEAKLTLEMFIILFNFNNNNKMIQSDKLVF